MAENDFIQNPFDSNKVKTNPDDLEQVFRISPSGHYSTAISDNFRGFNHRQAPSLIPINKEQYGMTFFTRPRCNLTSENLRMLRKMAPLLTNKEDSLLRIIRCWLDPVSHKKGVIHSPYVDDCMPFIPLLSNLLISLPGWPDQSAMYSTSQEGIRKEQYMLVDGTEEILRETPLTANFRNVSGDPLTPLFSYWLTYARAVYFGEMNPYPEAILRNEVDYDTRIYRLILDDKKQNILRIAATGFGFPVSNPIGAIFNFEADQGEGMYNQSLQQVSVQFSNSGIQYNDDILMFEFNQCSEQWFNPDLADGKRQSSFVKVPFDELQIFNFRGYPRINLSTYELEWWVRKDEYQQMQALTKAYKSTKLQG